MSAWNLDPRPRTSSPSFVSAEVPRRGAYLIPEVVDPVGLGAATFLSRHVKVKEHVCERRLYRSPELGEVVVYAVDHDVALRWLRAAEGKILFFAGLLEAHLRRGRP